MGVGRHVLADLHGAVPARLDDAVLLAACLRDAAKRCGLTPIGDPVLHCFPGGGVTGFLLLSESHIALHTYPEKGFMALDVFSCGPGDPEAAVEVFKVALGCATARVTSAVRG